MDVVAATAAGAVWLPLCGPIELRMCQSTHNHSQNSISFIHSQSVSVIQNNNVCMCVCLCWWCACVCMLFVFQAKREGNMVSKKWKQSYAKTKTLCEGAIYYIWSTEIPPYHVIRFHINASSSVKVIASPSTHTLYDKQTTKIQHTAVTLIINSNATAIAGEETTITVRQQQQQQPQSERQQR